LALHVLTVELQLKAVTVQVVKQVGEAVAKHSLWHFAAECQDPH